MINIGVDAWDYRPVGASVLGELIAAGPADLAPVGPGVVAWPRVRQGRF